MTERPCKRSLWTRAGLVLAWTVALAAAVATGLRWVDVAWSPLVLVQSVSPVAGAVALVALAGVLLPGSRRSRIGVAGVCTVVLVVHAAIWAPWLSAESPRPGTELTVMSANLYLGRADAQAIARAVRTHGVDVLVLVELTDGARADLRRQGVNRMLPHVVGGTRADPGGTVVRSRVPLTAVPGTDDTSADPMSFRQPAAELRVGRPLVVRGVHPAPPVPGRVDRWRATLDELADWVRTQPGALVVAGDFNASVDHPGMRHILDGGLRDAHEVAGAGRPPTWPRGRTVPAFVHIDHVLVRGLDVASVREIRIPGSDHDAVVARLVVPDGR